MEVFKIPPPPSLPPPLPPSLPPSLPPFLSLDRQFAFSHGTFEKVNYLGYDDHVVLNRSLSFLLGEEAAEATAEVGREDAAGRGAGGDGGVGGGGGGDGSGGGGVGGGKLLTILTVSCLLG